MSYFSKKSSRPALDCDYITSGYLTREKTPLNMKNPPFTKELSVHLVDAVIKSLRDEGCTTYGVICGYQVAEERWQFCTWYTRPGLTAGGATQIRSKLSRLMTGGPARFNGSVVEGRFEPPEFYSNASGQQWRCLTKVSVTRNLVVVSRVNSEKDVSQMFDLTSSDGARSDMDRRGFSLEAIINTLKFPKKQKSQSKQKA